MKAIVMEKINWDTEEGIMRVQEEILKVARHSARTSPAEFEDIVQDLWLYILPKKPTDIAHLRDCLVKHSIDLFRSACRYTGGVTAYDFNDPVAQRAIETRPSPWAHDYDGDKKPYQLVNPDFDYKMFESPEESVLFSTDIVGIIDLLGEKERKYLIAKGYLSANIESFKDEYMKMFDALSEDNKKKVTTSSRPDSDDVIVKVFLGIRTGTNSGTIRSIKNNIRKIFSQYVVAV